MIRISTFKTVLRMRFPAALLAFLLPLLAKADVGITVVTSQEGNEVTADFLVYNFQGINSMQLAITWNPQILDYQSLTNLELGPTANFAFNQPPTNDGLLIISWYSTNPSIGTTFPNCNSIFTLKFTALSPQPTPIIIQDQPGLPIEFTDYSGGNVPFVQNLGCADVGLLAGNIFHDQDNDCQKDGAEQSFQGWNVKIIENLTAYYRTTDANGYYYFYGFPGSYQVSIVSPADNLWSACQPVQTVDIVEGQTTNVDFAAQPLVNCEQLMIDLASPFLRRCFESTYQVHYCNNGTLDVSGAYVELTLDPLLTYTSSSIPFSTSDGQTYTFPVGDLQIGDCGYFAVNVLVSCDAVLGQTHCSEARIFPSEICQSFNPLWDGSILKIKGACDGDSVRFSVANVGDAMPFPVDFIVIEDDMVNFEGAPIQLGAGENTSVVVPANGSTWRMEMDNEDSSPFNAPSASSVEGCGVNGSGSFSIGFVTQFPQDDNTPFTDIDCQPNVDSYDPNDKTGYPNGFCAAHFIESGQEIEYRIRFQNTGTAPAINIVVQDTLPLTLNPATVQPGASSHPYDFEILGNGVLRFTFTDIMLPDSTADEPGSHGFVNFTVAQASNNAIGTVINNQAAIYFDFNAPVYTNTYTHTVADDFVQSAGTDGDISLSGHVLTWYGEPVEDVEVTLAPTCPVYSDSDGYFEFLQLDTADYALLPSKLNLDKQAWVTVLDRVILQNDVLFLGSSCEDSMALPYHLMAGELNGGGGLTTFDFAQLAKMIVGLDVGNSAQFWRFIDANYVFPDYDPLVGYPIPPSINFSMLSENVDNANIIAIKPGDVINESSVDSSEIVPHLFFVSHPLEGGNIRVDVKSNELQSLRGMQFGLTWNPVILGFDSLEASALPVLAYNGNVPGQLQLVTANADLPDSSTLFTIIFDPLASIGNSTTLALDESLLPFQVVVENCKLAGATVDNATIQVEIADGTQNPTKGSLQLGLSPNPIRAGQPIHVQTKDLAPGEYRFQLLDANGALVRQWSENLDQGQPYLTLQSPLVKGLYLLKAVRAEVGSTVRFVVY